MKPFILLLLGIILGAPQHLAAQNDGAVQGRVEDAQTGDPLAGAHVFLTGSTRGAITNAEGRYRLDALPPGTYEIAASMLGFETQSQHLTLSVMDPATLDFRLRSTVIPLGEVVVASTRPEHWQAYLERFQDLFLGLTENAAKCTLVNPEVLDFTYDEEADRLRATARQPLIIENRAFGYRVHYHLSEFESIPGEVRYLGTSRFEELEPRNKREHRRWERRRRRAYEGSLQHFLSTLFDDGTVETARKAGFDVSVAPRFDTDPAAVIPVRSGAVLQQAPQSYNRLLAFEDHLLIVYKPDLPVSPPAGVPGAAAPPPGLDEYGSWITLNNGPAEINRFGYLHDPYAVTTFGLWSRERLGDLLPRDYKPD